MRLIIPKCQHCPRMPDCEHRATIKREAKKAETPIPVVYNCKLYSETFTLGDEVFVRFEYRNERNDKAVLENQRAVIVGVPQYKKQKYGVAFFEHIHVLIDVDYCDGH